MKSRGYGDPSDHHLECGWTNCTARPVDQLGICQHHAIKAYMWVVENAATKLEPLFSAKPKRDPRAPRTPMTEPVRIIEPSVVERARRARLAPLPMASLTEDGFVYAIRFSDRIKFGYSSQPRKRLAELPLDEVLGLMPGSRIDEAEVHARFVEHRHSGEWYYDHPDLRAFIAENMQRPDAA